MKRLLPAILISAALGTALLLSRKAGPSRESLIPLSRTVAEQEKGLDRATATAFPLSPDEERSIGEGIAGSLSQPPSAPGTPRAAGEARWREFGGTAARSALVTRFRGRYEFRVVDGGGLNAFAVPGGYVFITRGLLDRLGSDGDALLFVLGHEIGHVELGHCADAYRLTHGAHDPITAVLGGVLSVPRLFAELHFSSTQELEADRYAVRLVRSVGADPRAGLRVFDALGLRPDTDTKRDPGTVAAEGLADYFHTHPGAWERRAALERELGPEPASPPGARVPPGPRTSAMGRGEPDAARIPEPEAPASAPGGPIGAGGN